MKKIKGKNSTPEGAKKASGQARIKKLFQRRNAVTLEQFTSEIEDIANDLTKKTSLIREAHLLRALAYWKTKNL